MKKAMVLGVQAAFALISANAFADRCEYYSWKDNHCTTDAAYTPSPKCVYHQWKRVPCKAEKPVKAAPAPKAEKFVLEGVYFDTGKATIKSSSFSVLDENVAKLKAHPKTEVLVVGYTDDRGSDVANQRLSEARALSVKNYFVGKGIPTASISTAGRGESSPIADNATEAGRAKNRRIELEVK